MLSDVLYICFIHIISIFSFCEICANVRYEVTEEQEFNSTNNSVYNLKWMLMPSERNSLQAAILSDFQSRESSSNVESVKFYLYTRDNAKRAEVRSMNGSCKPLFKYFKSQRKTKILIHGFGDNVKESYMAPALRDAFLSKGDYNIFVVDWSELAAKPWYVSAKRNTQPVAQHVAKFIDYMSMSSGMKSKNVHIVGFSLGAHVAGLAADNVKCGRVKHVTGLDPALVLYESSSPQDRIDASQADLVEIIHTSGGYIGFEKSIGHRDFYPNGGVWPQPGCVVDYAAVCSHRRAYYYYRDAIVNTKSFVGVACDSYEQFLKNECKSKKSSIELDYGSSEEKNHWMFFLTTNSQRSLATEL